MPAFLKLGDIKGNPGVKDGDFKDMIPLQSVSHSITRSIQAGATAANRQSGSTHMGDIHLVKAYDKASTLLAEACSNGKTFKEAEIHMCSVHDDGGKPKLIKNHTMKLKEVIISSYSYHGSHDSKPPPSDELTLSFTEAELVHTVLKGDNTKDSEVTGKLKHGA